MQRSIQYNFQEENVEMKETILLFNITDRNTKLKLERILLPLKLRIRQIPVSQYGQTLAAGSADPYPLQSYSDLRQSALDTGGMFYRDQKRTRADAWLESIICSVNRS